MSLISIVINCHNGGQFLEECLNSIFNQTYQNWEIIFLDNVSNDNSIEILSKFSDKRIRYYKTDRLEDLYKARNLAVEKCNGKYVSFLDTDDMWSPEKLEKQINFLERNQKFKVVFSNYYFLKDNIKEIKHKKNLPTGLITQELLNNYSIGILTVLLERDIFTKIKFNDNYNIIGDFDFFIRLSQKSEIGSIQEPLASYRLHGDNFSLNKIDLYKKELEEWIRDNEKKLNLFKFSLYRQKILLFKLKIKYILRKIKKF